MVATLCQWPRLFLFLCHPKYVSVCPSSRHRVHTQATRWWEWRAADFLSKKDLTGKLSISLPCTPYWPYPTEREDDKIQSLFWAVLCSAIILKQKRKNGYWELRWNSSFNWFITFILFWSLIDNPFHSHSRYAAIHLATSRVSGSVYCIIKYPGLQSSWIRLLSCFHCLLFSISLPGYPLAFSLAASPASGGSPSHACLVLPLLYTLICLTLVLFYF